MKLTTTQFLGHLAHIAASVKEGDSLEGSFGYTACDADEWEVEAAYRIGNLMGQGGMVLVESTERADEGASFPARLTDLEIGKAIGSADPDRRSSSSVDATARLIEKKGDTRMDTPEGSSDVATAPTNRKASTVPIHHPMQNHNVSRSIPASVALRAYEVYCHVFGAQPALIDLEGSGCRGGFSANELIAFLYARSFPKEEWSRRVDEAFQKEAHR